MRSSKQIPRPGNDNSVIDLDELFRVLWAGKWLIVGVTTTAAVIAVVVSLSLPDIYRAEALLAPNDQEGAGGLSALAAQYGGLASLAGINLGSGKLDKTALGLEILESRKFISEFVERHGILVALMAAEGWDSGSGRLKINPKAYDEAAGKWVRKVRPPENPVPSGQQAYLRFVEILEVRHDKASGFITVAVEHVSPQVAKQWVDWLVADLNAAIMQQDVAEAEQAIDYLNQQIGNTSVADLQKVFFSLIEEQTKTVMLAKVTDEYLLKTIDPAVAPELRSRPKRSLIVVFWTMMGFFLAAGGLIISASTQRS